VITTVKDSRTEVEREMGTKESTPEQEVALLVACILDKNEEFPQDKQITETVYEGVVDRMLAGYDWLDLYIQKETGGTRRQAETEQEYYRTQLSNLRTLFHELYPDNTDKQITEVLLYVLNNPESNLKQRTVAEHMYMNSTLLSASFTDKTKVNFVNYLANVRLYRAAFFLAYTELHIAEIARRLNYKDTAYFSRIFRKKFQMSPTEFRSRYKRVL
jgi:AraC-like DNA-binding protein